MFPSGLPNHIYSAPRPRGRAPTAAAADLEPVVSRRAAAPDEPALERLAALDERELPRGERLIALLAGRPVAAVEVRSGFTVADPFVSTGAIVELLGLRAAHVRR